MWINFGRNGHLLLVRRAFAFLQLITAKEKFLRLSALRSTGGLNEASSARLKFFSIVRRGGFEKVWTSL
ncbi:MAG: hypothetical protein DME90_01175 [Verrucomicrobia bacterium]|nr:MAG: hypothetical protein DME90_01175 [Verrucomicrobiota bacterium]